VHPTASGRLLLWLIPGRRGRSLFDRFRMPARHDGRRAAVAFAYSGRRAHPGEGRPRVAYRNVRGRRVDHERTGSHSVVAGISRDRRQRHRLLGRSEGHAETAPTAIEQSSEQPPVANDGAGPRTATCRRREARSRWAISQWSAPRDVLAVRQSPRTPGFTRTSSSYGGRG
jgi:hypothetical protein